MGLLQNGFRHKTTGKFYGATLLDGACPSVLNSNFSRAGAERNQRAGEGITSRYASVPSASKPPYCWVLAQEGGAVKSFRRGEIILQGASIGELGYPVTAQGTATLTGAISLDGLLSAIANGAVILSATSSIEADGIATASVTLLLDGSASIEGGAIATAQGAMVLDASVIAGLVVSAAANGVMLLEGGASIDGALESTATGAMTLQGVVDLVGALSGVAQGTATLSATSSLDGDALPTATGSMTLTGAIEIMADGILTADTDGGAVDALTNESIANAVMNFTLENGYNFQQVTRLMSAILAGKTAIVDNGDGTATVTFRSLADNKYAAFFEMDGSDRINRTDDI